MKFVCVLFCALFPFALAAPPPPSTSRASAASPISVKSSQFVDAFGRQRIFHGINIVSKEFPWIDPVFQNASFAPFIQSIGVNVVRLGWMWSGFEPEEGKFNMTYYAQVRAAANSLAAHGIYVILDAHQDILSSRFCLYDGFPLWVINKSSPAHAFPWPLRGDCSRPWGENAFSEAAGQAYQDFYDNHAGMRDAFVRFWTFSAQLWSDCDSVLGFEVRSSVAARMFHFSQLAELSPANQRAVCRSCSAISRPPAARCCRVEESAAAVRRGWRSNAPC